MDKKINIIDKTNFQGVDSFLLTEFAKVLYQSMYNPETIIAVTGSGNFMTYSVPFEGGIAKFTYDKKQDRYTILQWQ
jgi:hypothetical protein